MRRPGAWFGLVALVATFALARPVAAQSVPEGERIERFRADLRAFATDLLNVRRIPVERARYLAYIAVSEAYRYDLPPSLLIGVMMVEDPELKSGARSHVGAIGLMQVMPLWQGVLGPYFGMDLTDDATNLRYGIWILAHYSKIAHGVGHNGWREALLRYNGWGPRYPDWVRDRVERYARATCPTHNFDACVAGPLQAVFGR